MNVFLVLNRVLRIAVLGLGLGALWMLWERRERARPLLDLYVVWEGVGYRVPPPLERTPVVVTRAITENVLQVKDTNGLAWNVGLAGLGGVFTDGQDPRWRSFALQTRSNLMVSLVGRSASLAIVSSQSNRTALGFLYVGTNSQNLAVDLVTDGRLRWLEDSTRMLPLREQALLRAADRRARGERLGLWRSTVASTDP
ncbi:MAG: hypothetical protein JNL10_10855 [Verrucomicrobiales bacterium]|nr:hypothetical protein [Verrucomicrobiales bacterium]